jgi:ankyrin repeat protein
MRAAEDGKDGAVKFLLSVKAKVDIQDEEGKSALHHACITDHFSIVGMLLECGADPQLTDAEGNTPLMRCQPKSR